MFGATGQFPEGKITDRDEGEIQFGIASAPNKVLVSFGKPVAWIAFTPEQAIALAASLMEKAQDAVAKKP